jgi:Family of unknown function (DUF5715)
MFGFHSLATGPATRTFELLPERSSARRTPRLALLLAGIFFLGLLFAKIPMAAGFASRTHVHPHHRATIRPRSPQARTHNASARERKTPYHPQHAALEARQVSPLPAIALLPLENYRHLPPLRGSYESLVRQNDRNEQEGLERIQDDTAMAAMLTDKELVALPLNIGMRVDERLATNRRYCRPWTADFLVALGRVHYARFHSPLQVNSAVRTVAYQRHLLLVNGNAAPAEGDIASPHLTGATIDIAKKGLSPSEVGWMRAYLLPLQAAGKIDVEEEFEQACFHITVYKSYVPPSTPILVTTTERSPRPRHRRGNLLLATRLH